jgi:hypothetical protein
LGVVIGSVLYFHPEVTIKDKVLNSNKIVNVVNKDSADLRIDYNLGYINTCITIC